MTEKNTTVANRFVEGGTTGRASRFEIEVLDGYRCIVGYGWAVYVAFPIDGKYALFGDGYKTDNSHVGWAGYSGTTTGHIQTIKRALEEADKEYLVADARPERSDVLRNDDFDLEGFALGSEVEPLDYTGHLYRRE